MLLAELASREHLDRSRLLRGERPVWLLRMAHAGQIYRLATRRAVPVDADGVSHQYRPGLSAVELRIQAELLELAPSDRSVSIEILTDDDWALTAARGHRFASAECELSLWLPETPLEERVVQLTGAPKNAQFGERPEPLSFTLASRAWSDSGLWPPLAAVIDDETWPSHEAAAAGAVYPYPWGRPGVYVDSGGATATTPGSPAPLVHTGTGKRLIAGDVVAASSVTVYDATSGASLVQSVSTEVDGLGRLVSTVPGHTGTFPAGDDVYVIWDQGGGGILDPYATGELAGAGSVLRYMLSRTSIGVDHGRLGAVIYVLDRLVTMAGYIDERITPWEWLRSHLLPLLPIAVDASPLGLYPRVWLPDQEQATTTLTEGREVHRSGRVTEETDDLRHELILRWALDADTGDYRRTTILTGARDPDDLEQVDDVYILAARSYVALDQVEVHEIAADYIYDAGSALQVLRMLARILAVPPLDIAVEGSPWLLTLEPLDPVDYTDAGLSLTSQRCWIREMVIDTSAAVGLILRAIPDLPRDTRAT